MANTDPPAATACAATRSSPLTSLRETNRAATFFPNFSAIPQTREEGDRFMPTLDKLRQLTELHDTGALSDADFKAAKTMLLDAVPEAEESTETLIEAEPFSPASSDPMPTLAIAMLTAVVVALVAMLTFGLKLSAGATIGIATLGAITLLLYRDTNDPA
ncbi:MAG: hypothetical protein ACJA1F_000283 [Paracoccaceae bacterium]